MSTLLVQPFVSINRMSNVLAGIGRGQLKVLEERVAARRRNFSYYEKHLGDLPGVAFQPEAEWGLHNRWLTCLTIEPEAIGATREDVRLALEAENIEARPVWKPMHTQFSVFSFQFSAASCQKSCSRRASACHPAAR